MNKLSAPKAEAEAARARLQSTIGTVRARTKPKVLLNDIKLAARKRAIEATFDALSNAKTRPIVAAGTAAMSIAYLLRNPILKSLRKRMTRSG